METDKLINILVMEGAQKPLPSLMKQMLFFLMGTMVWLALFVYWTDIRPDFADKMAEPFYLPELVSLFCTAASAALAALALSRPDGYQIPWIRFVPFGFLCVWALTAVLNMNPMGTPTLAQVMDPHQFDCVKCILILSLPPCIAMFMLVHYGAPIQSLWAGGMAAGSVAMFAYLSMRIIEPNDNPLHLLIWHALPVLVLCLIGMLAGKAFLRWR